MSLNTGKSVFVPNGNVFKQTVVSFMPLMNGENFIKQAYDHLKTLPEFAGATNC